MSEIRVSVVMASYNGAAYLAQQLDSILAQLGSSDELLISDDHSGDNTPQILQQYAHEDERIQLLCGPGCGVVANFSHALTKARGQFVFLSDQDDQWLPGKVEKVLLAFQDPKVILVMHDAIVTDDSLRPTAESFFSQRGSRTGFLRNLIKNSYIGCCMAFKRTLLDVALPFPADIPMHDQWLGLLAERKGQVRLLREPLLYYRRHGQTVTTATHGTITAMIHNRWIMVIRLGQRLGNKGRQGALHD